MRFKRTRRGIVADVAPVEASVLGQAARDLRELLADPDGGPRDPLEELVGLSGRQAVRPTDPALLRLFPDAYDGSVAANEPEAVGDFRRYTEPDLRAGKRAALDVVLATLPDRGGRLVLDRDQAHAWLGALNDLRLVLGTRLEVTEDDDPMQVRDDDPRAHALRVYGWLGWLQESLLSCLTPRG